MKRLCVLFLVQAARLHHENTRQAFMPFLNQRCREPEVMDQPGLDRRQHVRALDGLARINWWSGSAAILWPSLRTLARQATRTLRVLDLATGGGDVPVRLWQRAQRAGVPLQLEGCDISPVAVEYAAAGAHKRGADVSFFVHDAVNAPLLDGYDVLMCSLFLHHLDNAAARTLLERMGRQARSLVLVNDLVRGWPGYLLAQLGTRVLSRSPVVHTDGPLSVQAAFTRAELQALAEQAGLHGATVLWRWPWRMLLTWRRP
jgi:2-polyprenyl-3-methyl-5-hydroxy-6-metoxy-1,4-benzoquinol methylase